MNAKMTISKKDAELISAKLEDSASDYDFNWRLYAKLCITAGRKDKYRETAEKVHGIYNTFPFNYPDTPISGLPMAMQY